MLVVVHNNKSPYFEARLRAAARRGRLYAVTLGDAETRDAGAAFGQTIVPVGDGSGMAAAGRIMRGVEQALDALGPEVVAVHGWSRRCALSALAWATRNSVPTVVLGDMELPGRGHPAAINLIKRRVFRQFGAFLMGGEKHAEYLAASGVARDRILVGYDVVDNEHFRMGAEHARRDAVAQRHRLGLPDRYFLSVCRFVEAKNLPFLFDAYAAYRDAFAGKDPWRLVVVGDGPLRPLLEHRRRELRLEQDIILTGWKNYDEMPAYFGLAEAFVLASMREAWGLVVNEAMAAGLPVLVSRNAASACDLVAEGRNGYTFNPRDVAALAALFGRLASDASDAPAMGRASADAIFPWSLETFADRLWSAAAIARRHGRPPVSASDGVLLRLLILRPGAPL